MDKCSSVEAIGRQKKRPTVGRRCDLPWVGFGVLEKSLVERAGGGLGERGVGGSSSLGCEGEKKHRSLERKVYFYDRGNLGALPWTESAGAGRGEQGEGTLALRGGRQLEPYPSEHEL